MENRITVLPAPPACFRYTLLCRLHEVDTRADKRYVGHGQTGQQMWMGNVGRGSVAMTYRPVNH